MRPLGLSACRLAKDLAVPVTHIQAIVAERHKMSCDAAFSLARSFHTTPAFWANLQRDYDREITALAPDRPPGREASPRPD